MIDARLQKSNGESAFEWKLRCCKAKINHETDMDWQEISDMLELGVTGDHLRKTAYGMLEYDEYIHSENGVSTTILSISDLHYPFAKDVGELSKYANKIDVLQLNGDLMDCSSISKFVCYYRSSPIDEIIGCRDYLIALITMLKPKKVIANYGNHELRLGAHLATKLDNELQELMPMTALDYIFQDGFTHFNRANGTKTKYSPLCDVFPDIEFIYDGKWYSQVGDTIFCHPRAFSSAPLKTAEKAMYWFRNEGFSFKTIVMAHTHRLGYYKIGNSAIYEQGAFCDTDRMNYTDGSLVNSQKQGYIVIRQNQNGETIQDKIDLVSLN